MTAKLKMPRVAIIGRPNVGKSTLFNRLAGGRISIVDEIPGVTRDIVSGECEWEGYLFEILDTGGLGEESTDPLRELSAKKAWETVESAHLIVFVTDATCGVTKGELELKKKLLRLNKPIILAVNKVDHANREAIAQEFYSLGIEKCVFISAVSGRNVGELCELMKGAIDWREFPEARLHFEKAEDEEVPQPARHDINVVILGKRNVGKSSLLNALLREEKVIVSDIPGTTRDAITDEISFEGITLRLTDTAGALKISKMDELEFYSYTRTRRSLELAEVCLLVLDASTGVQEMDKRVAKHIEEKRKAVVLVLNKWDLFEDTDANREIIREQIYGQLAKLHFAPLAFVSAKENYGLESMLRQVMTAHKNFHRTIPMETLKKVVAEETSLNPPPVVKNRTLRIFSVRQMHSAPPTFIFEVNSRTLLRKAYRNFLENAIRRHFDFAGTHISLRFVEKAQAAKRSR